MPCPGVQIILHIPMTAITQANALRNAQEELAEEKKSKKVSGTLFQSTTGSLFGLLAFTNISGFVSK